MSRSDICAISQFNGAAGCTGGLDASRRPWTQEHRPVSSLRATTRCRYKEDARRNTPKKMTEKEQFSCRAYFPTKIRLFMHLGKSLMMDDISEMPVEISRVQLRRVPNRSFQILSQIAGMCSYGSKQFIDDDYTRCTSRCVLGQGAWLDLRCIHALGESARARLRTRGGREPDTYFARPRPRPGPRPGPGPGSGAATCELHVEPGVQSTAKGRIVFLVTCDLKVTELYIYSFTGRL